MAVTQPPIDVASWKQRIAAGYIFKPSEMALALARIEELEGEKEGGCSRGLPIDPCADVGPDSPRSPRFGDIIENGWASQANPTRVGFFVRQGRRTGRMNAGRYYEVTDGKGKFWELPLHDHKIKVYPLAARADGPRVAAQVASEGSREEPNPTNQIEAQSHG